MKAVRSKKLDARASAPAKKVKVVEPEKYNQRKSVVGLLEEWRRKGMNGKKNGMIRAFFPANTSDFFYSSNPTSTASFNCSLNGVLGC